MWVGWSKIGKALDENHKICEYRQFVNGIGYKIKTG